MMVRNKNKHWYYLWITIVKLAMLFSLIYQILTDSNLSYSNLSCNWFHWTHFFKFTVLGHANIDEECYISVPTPQPLPYCYKAEAESRETSLDKHIKKLGLVRKCKATKKKFWVPLPSWPKEKQGSVYNFYNFQDHPAMYVFFLCIYQIYMYYQISMV